MSWESDGALAERLRRAETLVRLGRNADAADELRVLLEAGDRCPQRPRMLAMLGQLLMNRGELGDAQQVLVEAQEAAQRAGDDVGRLQALGVMGQTLRRDGRFDGALQVARDGEAIARGMREVASEATFAADSSRALLMLGDADGALADARRAVAIAGDTADPVAALRHVGWLTTLLADAGHLDEALATAEDGLARCRANADPYGEASFLNTLADVADAQGRHADALDARRRSTSVQIGDSQWGLLMASARRFVGDLGQSPDGYPYLWLAARSTAVAATLGGDEVRTEAMALAVHAMAAGILASPPEETLRGMDNVCELLHPIDPPQDYPPAPQPLSAAVSVIVRWMVGDPVDDLPVGGIDDALGTAPTLTTLVAEPSPRIRPG